MSEVAQRARALKSLLTPLYDEIRDKVITRMLNEYRGGTPNHDVLIGCVGELECLQYIMSKCDRDSKKGE